MSRQKDFVCCMYNTAIDCKKKDYGAKCDRCVYNPFSAVATKRTEKLKAELEEKAEAERAEKAKAEAGKLKKIDGVMCRVTIYGKENK